MVSPPVAARAAAAPLVRSAAVVGALFLSARRRAGAPVACAAAEVSLHRVDDDAARAHAGSAAGSSSSASGVLVLSDNAAAVNAVFSQAAQAGRGAPVSKACSRSRRARRQQSRRGAGDPDAQYTLVPVQLIFGVANLIADLKESTIETLTHLQEKQRSLASAAARATAENTSRRRRPRTDRTDRPESARGPSGKPPAQKVRSPLRDASRAVAIVTTAVLPWMTGTAVNPLLRAAYLAGDPDAPGAKHRSNVTLLVPWVPLPDQKVIYPSGLTFDDPRQQETYIRNWVVDRLGFAPKFKIAFYPGRYDPDKGSILAVGDITRYIPENEADIAILEEPEHLNWFHSGRRWSDKFNYVLGIVHTNYLEYIRRQKNGGIMGQWVKFYNQCVVRQHCHRIVKLSGAVQDFPRSTVSYVHGVSPTFLDVGRRIASSDLPALDCETAVADSPTTQFTKQVYFLGKVLWGKGYSELLSLVGRHVKLHGDASLGPNGLDVFGSGDDFDAVTARSSADKLPLNFHGPKDHAHSDIHSYKVFINPSLSDVVATTTAEALAMGKFVVVVKHPSNEFFSTFPNCLVYSTPDEFSECLQRALSTEPEPMTEELGRKLTWEAATERLMEAAKEPPITNGPKPKADKIIDDALFAVNNTLISVEPIRRVFGAGMGTGQDPLSLSEIPDLHQPGPKRKRLPQLQTPLQSPDFVGPSAPGPSSNPMRQMHLAFLESMRQLPSASGSSESGSGARLPERRINTLPESQLSSPTIFPWSRTPVSMGRLSRDDHDDRSASP